MSLEQLNFSGMNKIDVAIERMRSFERAAIKLDPQDGYYLCFSGGKDSIVIKELARLAEIKYKSHYNITGIDPPELVYYIKEHHKDVIMHKYEKSMFQLIEDRSMPPTRMVRYCCDVLKEHGGKGKFIITGVRWSESARRKNNRDMVEFDRYGSQAKAAKERREVFLNNDNDEKRRMMETCQIKGKHILNPIIDWTDEDVWEFIRAYKLPYCKLYDEGWGRVGCIGCPLNSKSQKRELGLYPKYRENYIRAFERMLITREKKGLPTEWKTGEEVMSWWLGE